MNARNGNAPADDDQAIFDRLADEAQEYAATAAGAGRRDQWSRDDYGVDSDVLKAERAADAAAFVEKVRELGSVAGAKAELALRARRAAERRIALDDAPPLRMLSASEFLAGDDLEFLVPGVIYPDSLARIFGAPGATKSFFVLHMLLCLATGQPWFGQPVPRVRVHYVMAEGEAVNRMRARAWLADHGLDESELDGWFHAVPHGLMLTGEGVARFCRQVADDGGSSVIVLDTKNRMMVGDESNGSDSAVMVRALDEMRAAAGGAAVVLIDHSGLSDDTRARGSNAVLAAMDTEILVRTGDNRVSTATVTRDKAGMTGHRLSYVLRTPEGHRHPVVVPTELPPGTVVDDIRWNEPSGWPLPADVRDATGDGAAAMGVLALFMRRNAREEGIGVSRAEATTAVMAETSTSRQTIHRAWNRLYAIGRLGRAAGATADTARSLWVERPGDPARVGGERMSADAVARAMSEDIG